MKKRVINVLATVALSGGLLGAAPAQATSYGIDISIPGVSFSYNSGGYCDEWGCPDDFWYYPIYYCPVYWGGNWYRGPVYYRSMWGRNYFWVHGGWRSDAWMGPRPPWACLNRFGPPLDLDFYIWNGFFVRDDWRYAWRQKRDVWWRHRRDWDHDHRNDTAWRAWLPPAQRNYDWNRERDWNKDRDWNRSDWNRRDWDRKNHINPPATPSVIPPPKAVAPPSRIHTPQNEKKAPYDRQQGGQMQPKNRMQGATPYHPSAQSPPLRFPEGQPSRQGKGRHDASEMRTTGSQGKPSRQNDDNSRDSKKDANQDSSRRGH